METISDIICRACLSITENMHPLFEIYDNDLTLAMMLQRFLQVEIYSEDSFPKYICENCAILLVQFYNFSTLFEKNNRKFHECFRDKLQNESPGEFKENTMTKNSKHVPDINCDSSSNDCKAKVMKNSSHEGPLINGNQSKRKLSQSSSCMDCEEIFLCPITSEMIHIKSKQISNENRMSASKVTVLTGTANDIKTEAKRRKRQKAANRCNTRQINTDQDLNYICEVCGQISSKKSYLLSHMETHISNKLYSCTFCGKQFQRRTALCRHRRLHTNFKEIICEMCGRAFTDKGTLKTHVKLIHMKTRNFKCIICNMTFPLKGTLDKHVRRHQQSVKNFSCLVCQTKYYDKSSVIRHYNTKHSGKFAKDKCRYCSKEYTSKVNLMKHMKKYHGDQPKDTNDS